MDFRDLSDGGCRVHTTLVYFFLDFSAWVLALLSLERLITVRWTMATYQRCTRRVSVVAIIIVGVILFALNLPFLILLRTELNENKTVCKPSTNEYFFKTIWPWIDLTAFALLPLAIHIVCNILIVCGVSHSFRESRRNRGSRMKSSTNGGSSKISHTDNRPRHSSNETPSAPTQNMWLSESANRADACGNSICSSGTRRISGDDRDVPQNESSECSEVSEFDDNVTDCTSTASISDGTSISNKHSLIIEKQNSDCPKSKSHAVEMERTKCIDDQISCASLDNSHCSCVCAEVASLASAETANMDSEDTTGVKLVFRQSADTTNSLGPVQETVDIKNLNRTLFAVTSFEDADGKDVSDREISSLKTADESFAVSGACVSKENWNRNHDSSASYGDISVEACGAELSKGARQVATHSTDPAEAGDASKRCATRKTSGVSTPKLQSQLNKSVNFQEDLSRISISSQEELGKTCSNKDSKTDQCEGSLKQSRRSTLTHNKDSALQVDPAKRQPMGIQRKRSSERIGKQDRRIVESMRRMLVGVSVVFCITNFPISVFLIVYNMNLGNRSLMEMLSSALYILMYTNNACNFIMYCVTSSSFRAELAALWRAVLTCCRHLGHRRLHSSSGSSSSSRSSRGQNNHRSPTQDEQNTSQERSLQSQKSPWKPQFFVWKTRSSKRYSQMAALKTSPQRNGAATLGSSVMSSTLSTSTSSNSGTPSS